MLKTVINAALRRAQKDVQISEDIPVGLVIGEVIRRGLALIRGLTRLQRRVFVYRHVRVRGRNLRLGRYVTLEEYVDVNSYARDGVEVGSHSRIGAYTIISATNNFRNLGKGVKIGAYSGIGQFGYIGASGGVQIGSKVIMGQYVSFHASNHVFSDCGRAIKDQGVTAQGILIEDDVWVGAKVTFLDGAVVRSHSVVAAGAVVSGEFPPNVVIGGVPARVLKKLS